MNKDLERVIDSVVDGTEGWADILTDHIIDRMRAEEKEIDKDTEAGKEIMKAIAEMSETINAIAAERFVDLTNGKVVDFSRDKANAIKIIDKLVETADVYYGKITDRIMDRVVKGERDVELDKEIAKEVTKKALEGFAGYNETLTDVIAEKINQ